MNRKNKRSDGLRYESLGIYRGIISSLFIVVGIGYLIWRYDTLGMELPFFSWALYLAEIYGLVSAMLHIFMCWRLTDREVLTPKSGLTVDVFVPTYNEPSELVCRTLLAVRNMDYPHKTWLLDDGNRPEMRALAERLGIEYLNRQSNEHAKAGNLNNALKHSSGEFIAIFDADHAPQKRFLTHTLGYFQDQSVAFVQTPQDFFNLDSYQHRLQAKGKKLWTEQSLFFKIIQRGKDYWNAAFFCGSCAVVRRSALLSIGNFATETVTEDLHTSLRLHKAGFNSVYHHETLAYGIAPGSIAPFLKQRVRWGQGAMHVLKIENIFFTSKLTVAQRLNYLASMMTYFDGWQKGLFYIAPAFVLITGILPISADGWVFLCWFLPYYLLSTLVFEEVARGYGGTIYIEQYNFARFAAFAWATLALFKNKIKFEVTDKSLSRDSAMRRLFLPQTVVLLFNSVAIPIGLILAMTIGHIPVDALIFNAIWASVNLTLGFYASRFTKQTEHFVRAEYRFPIPLALQLNDASIRNSVTVDNVSSSGCKMYGRLPDTTKKGSILEGHIVLPGSSLHIKAEVMSEIYGMADDTKFLKAVGCRFIWENQDDHDLLDLFLYGGDLQWSLSGLEDKNQPPSVWLMSQFRKDKTIQVEDRWATCDVSHISSNGGVRKIPGLIPMPIDGGDPHRVVVFSPLKINNLIAIKIYTRTGTKIAYGTIVSRAIIENSLGPVYLVKFEIKHGVGILGLIKNPIIKMQPWGKMPRINRKSNR